MNKNLLMIFLTLSSFCSAFGQQSDELKPYLAQADSIQMRYFRDSLGLSLRQTQQYFVLRDKFFADSDMIAGDTSLTEKEQLDRFRTLRLTHTTQLKKLFTPPIYSQFIVRVKLRMSQYNIAGPPLTDDSDY
ncbi:hypothetical protein [Flavihumibacter solisilvae]|uniref:Tail specific protease N-terminal domain-containing protein n=1 Tax=Flavihumibacter solisilvae TaxID=1349421 RepID=A0A0C1L6Q0_9BACT|nr:hypothetical protein [Flavihumibacter solisilvae]KIC91308.1 hypothetical protein OI18_22415 [Flavihumibacter solisilvae]